MGFDWIPAKNYKRHFICLDCQKGFKRPSEEDMKNDQSSNVSDLMNKFYRSKKEQDILNYIQTAHQKSKTICPNCEGEMQQVHYNFEVPPNRDSKAWKNLRKEMPANSKIDYKSYLNWHSQELAAGRFNLERLNQLKQNSVKLERVSDNV